MSTPVQQSSADPDIPAEISRRKPVALTPVAAEVTKGSVMKRNLTAPGASGIGSVDVSDEDEQPKKRPSKKALGQAKAARQRAELAMAADPLKGLTAAQVADIRGKVYEGQPKQDPMLGDRTPAFVNWIWANHPKDAAVRYAYRDIYPTE